MYNYSPFAIQKDTTWLEITRKNTRTTKGAQSRLRIAVAAIALVVKRLRSMVSPQYEVKTLIIMTVTQETTADIIFGL